jgi:hypothetical protein
LLGSVVIQAECPGLGETLLPVIEEAGILAVAFPVRRVDLKRPQRFQPRPLGFEPALEPRPFAKQRLAD